MSAEPQLDAAELRFVHAALELSAEPEELADWLYSTRHQTTYRQAVWRHTWPPPAAWGIGSAPMSVPPVTEADRDWFELREHVRPHFEAFRRRIDAEFAARSRVVQDAFKAHAGKGGDARTHYWRIRGSYVAQGYNTPASQIFDSIVGDPESRIFNTRVGIGVHGVTAEALRRVEADLVARGEHQAVRAWLAARTWVAPGGAERTGARDVGGFAPRFIAGMRTLSDHAFGLALDFDGLSNPHIKGKGVFDVLKRRTTGLGPGGAGLDFKEPFLARIASDGPADLPLVAAYVLGDAAAGASLGYPEGLHQISVKASNAVREWLAGALASEADRAALVTAAKAAVATATAALRTAKAARPVDKAAVETAAADLEWEKILLGWAEEALRTDPSLVDLRVLRKSWPGDRATDVMATWARTGIYTLPPELVHALKRVRVPWRGAQLGLTWGQEWRGSKDTMHFDFAVAKAIPPGPKVSLDQLVAEHARRAAPTQVLGPVF